MNNQSMAFGLAVIDHLGPAALAGDGMSPIDAFELGWKAKGQHIREMITTDHETKDQFIARVLAALEA